MGIARRPVNSPERLIAYQDECRCYYRQRAGFGVAPGQSVIAMKGCRASWRMQLAGLAIIAMIGPAIAADPAASSDPFHQLNDAAIAIYQQAKSHYLAAADPVVIVGAGSILIRQHGTVRRVGAIPPVYHLLKTVDHVPRSLWAALRPAIDGLDRDETWRSELTALRPRIDAVLAALPKAGFSADATSRDDRMLRACLGLIDRFLATGVPAPDKLQAELRALAPTVLADAADAARAQIDSIDRDVRPWWAGLSQTERDQTFVVVLGVKTARAGNAAHAYFINLLGAAEDGHRVVYAEGIFDEPGADGLLATLLTDRRLSVDFFTDERRMERDLLADGAEARLLELFGH